MPFVLLRFWVPDQEDPSEVSEELEIGCRKWLTMDDETGDIMSAWPENVTDPAKLKMFVTKHIEPDQSWTKHRCEIVSSYSNYLDAHIGAKNRIQNSAYETEKEIGRGCRKRIARKLSDSEDDSCPAKQPKLPKPPRIVVSQSSVPLTKKSPIKIVVSKATSAKRQNPNSNTLKIVRKDRGTKADTFDNFKKLLEEKRMSSELKKKHFEGTKKQVSEMVIATSPSWKASRSEPSQERSEEDLLNCTFEVEDDLQGRENHSSPSQLQRCETYIGEEVFADSPCRSTSELSAVKKALFGEPSSQKSPHKSSRRVSSSSQSGPRYFSSEFERKVLVLLNEINQKAEVISANQSKLNLNLIPNEKVVSRPEGMPAIPLKSSEELKEMERTLKDNSECVSSLSMYLSTNVSKDPEKEAQSARKVMAALIHNCVAKKYSLKGQKGKRSFCDLSMWNAVKGAILLKVDSNLSATEHAVQLWLRDAAYRKQEDGSPSKVRPKKSPPKC